MRLLADENFPLVLVEALRKERHDVLWARTDCTGWKDVVLLDFAESEARIVLTLDKDFWQIAIQRPMPIEQSGVVLFRVHPATAKGLEPLVRALWRRTRNGRDTSASSEWMESKCSLRESALLNL